MQTAPHTMTRQSPPEKFGHVAIFLHWTLAACIIFTVVLAWCIEAIDDGNPAGVALALHKSIGITIFVLTWIRLVWRLTHRAPPYPAGMSRLQHWGAAGAHVLLYLLAIALPITGYISVAARGRETAYFWLLPVPMWVPLDRVLTRTAEAAHAYGTYVLYVLVAAHVGAALYHRLVLRDQIFSRMWPLRSHVPRQAAASVTPP